MKTIGFLCCAVLLAGLLPTATPAQAQEKIGIETPAPEAGPNCDITGYKSERQAFSPPFALPDNTDTDVPVGGPIFMPADGDIINDVILEVLWSHTWVGDVIMKLYYDADCTGPGGEVSTTVLCRPYGTALSGPLPCRAGTGTTVGCGANVGTSATNSANLPATYYFSDEALAPIAEGACPTLAPAGCYKPSLSAAFQVFRGLPKGGCWRLTMADWAVGDLGRVDAWAVHVRNQRPVPAVAASWGSIKSTYR